jgi:hypothetical protein
LVPDRHFLPRFAFRYFHRKALAHADLRVAIVPLVLALPGRRSSSGCRVMPGFRFGKTALQKSPGFP